MTASKELDPGDFPEELLNASPHLLRLLAVSASYGLYKLWDVVLLLIL